MPIQAFAALNCSVARPLSVLGERWALLVVRDVSLGKRRFDQIQASLGIATNVLSQRLATLTDEGILERRAYSEHPERFEYRLTDKGRDLMPVLWALMRWGDKWTAGESGPPVELVHDDCGQVTQMVPACSACGEELIPERGHVHAQPGPGASAGQRAAASS